MIYRITNIINGKTYIGMTSKTLEERFDRHRRNAQSGGDLNLYKSMRKHGIENFKIEFLCDGMDLEEIAMIAKHKPEYNMTPGGTGGDTSKSPKYIKAMEERRDLTENLGNRFKGKKHTEAALSLQSKKRIDYWENLEDEKRKIMSEKISGEKNGMHGKLPKNAVKVIYHDKVYNSIKSLEQAENMSFYKLKKLGAMKYNEST